MYEYLKSNRIDVRSLPWFPRRLYVAGSNPAELRNYLPLSHRYATREVTSLPPTEVSSLFAYKAKQTLPTRTWVRIKHGLYKGDIGFVEESNETNAILAVAPRERPYDLPQQAGEKSLFSNELAIIAGLNLEPISSLDGVDIGFTCDGNQFIRGLLRLTVPTHSVTLVKLPHPDDIAFYMITNFERPFVEETVHLFSAQFWRELDPVEIHRGDLSGSRGPLVDVEWHKRIASVLLHTVEIQERDSNYNDNIVYCAIPELRRIFTAGQAVRVMAGPYPYDGTVTLQHDGQSPNVSLWSLFFFYIMLIANSSSRSPAYCWNPIYQTMSAPLILSTLAVWTCLCLKQRTDPPW